MMVFILGFLVGLLLVLFGPALLILFVVYATALRLVQVALDQ